MKEPVVSFNHFRYDIKCVLYFCRASAIILIVIFGTAARLLVRAQLSYPFGLQSSVR